MLRDRCTEASQRGDGPLALCGIIRPEGGDPDDPLARLRVLDQLGVDRQLVRTGRRKLAIEVQNSPCLRDRVGDEAGEDISLRMQLELEGGGDAEVAAAAAQRPEEVRMRLAVGGDELAIGGDEVDGEQVVDRHAVLAN